MDSGLHRMGVDALKVRRFEKKPLQEGSIMSAPSLEVSHSVFV